jgi:hypothetical protein
MSALSDLGTLQGILQGLITLSIGALISIQVFNLHIRVGNTVIVKGNNNVVQFITHNLYANTEYKLSFGFRCLLLILILSCVFFSWLPTALVIEVVVLSVLLIPISFSGILRSSNGMNAICYFVSTLFISWVIWNNRALMDFVIDWSPALYPTWAEFSGNSNIIPKTFRDIGNFVSILSASISVLAAIFGISWLVLLQIQTAFSFLINRGRFDDALKFSVCNAGLSFLMILLSGGVLAALSAPQLLGGAARTRTPFTTFYSSCEMRFTTRSGLKR